ncbi:hypothetical protein [Fimbriiglobus ruber]|uniref:Uncharacterized protein n=1 Tax=Fimbriiglobus ruber TaxID=1908690 RepID=A0A225E274_9BACT|nr:hypothetical protein [Fimbriiglobus ruber]OWK43589.1 hypothetical protein FRUB_03188 [Fimbriiglobus ruber]
MLPFIPATGCRSDGNSNVAFVRGTEVVPGEASHRDDRPPAWPNWGR